MDIPPLPRPKDHTGLPGLGPGEGGGHRDVVTELTQEDEIRLLAKNNIDLRARVVEDKKNEKKKVGAMPGFVLGATLLEARHFAVHFSKVTLSTPAVGRRDSVSLTYTEFKSNLQRQTVVAGSTGIGIPGIFKVDASYRDASAVSTYDKKVKAHFQASQLIPKAHVIFNEDDITLDPQLMTKIENACSGKAGAAENLLNVLKDYGHFVPLSMLLGGRISLHTSTELSDRSQFEIRKTELKTAADAKFSADGVPVAAGGGVGVGTGTTTTTTLSQQAESLLMEVRGGDPNLASSEPGTLGTKWIASVGPYLEWSIIGFDENSLVPIIEFLRDEELKGKCIEILRQYFLESTVL